MGRKRKLAKLEQRLGTKLPYFICGLMNLYGEEKTAKHLNISVPTLRMELNYLNIERRWIVLDDTIQEFIDGEQEIIETEKAERF